MAKRAKMEEPIVAKVKLKDAILVFHAKMGMTQQWLGLQLSCKKISFWLSIKPYESKRRRI